MLKINSTTLNQSTSKQDHLTTFNMAEYKQDISEEKWDQIISNSQESSNTESRKRKNMSDLLGMKGAGEIEFEPAKVQGLIKSIGDSL